MIRKQLSKAVVGFLLIANKGLAFFIEKLKRKKETLNPSIFNLKKQAAKSIQLIFSNGLQFVLSTQFITPF